MAEFIVDELYVFLVMIAIGAAMSATYDVLRIIRRAVRHSVAVTSCEDVLYWIIWAFSAYRIFLFINDGCFRVYMIAGILIGSLAYHMIAGRFIVPFMGGIIRKIKEIVIKVLKNIIESYKIRLISKKSETNGIRGGHIEKKQSRPEK